MSWQDNRRRKRRWYKKFDALAKGLLIRLQNPQANAADIMTMFFDIAAAHRLFRYNWIKNSAYESLLLAIKDNGLTDLRVTADKDKSNRVIGVAVDPAEPKMISIPVRINKDGKFEVGSPYPKLDLGPPVYDKDSDSIPEPKEAKAEPPF